MARSIDVSDIHTALVTQIGWLLNEMPQDEGSVKQPVRDKLMQKALEVKEESEGAGKAAGTRMLALRAARSRSRVMSENTTKVITDVKASTVESFASLKTEVGDAVSAGTDNMTGVGENVIGAANSIKVVDEDVTDVANNVNSLKNSNEASFHLLTVQYVDSKNPSFKMADHTPALRRSADARDSPEATDPISMSVRVREMIESVKVQDNIGGEVDRLQRDLERLQAVVTQLYHDRDAVTARMEDLLKKNYVLELQVAGKNDFNHPTNLQTQLSTAVGSKDQALKEKEEAIKDMNQALKERDQALKEKAEAIKERDQALADPQRLSHQPKEQRPAKRLRLDGDNAANEAGSGGESLGAAVKQLGPKRRRTAFESMVDEEDTIAREDLARSARDVTLVTKVGGMQIQQIDPKLWEAGISVVDTICNVLPSVLQVEGGMTIELAALALVWASLRRFRWEWVLDFVDEAPYDNWYCFEEILCRGWEVGDGIICNGRCPQHKSHDCIQVRKVSSLPRNTIVFHRNDSE
ncbi:hypothetical protein SLS62_008810 [Diatrype stigma]|uniref:Uncharacterized protein n=1 Tax=Diatrype stigma TaxID=117547 RepID=A0AAN9UIU8_9PEZI